MILKFLQFIRVSVTVQCFLNSKDLSNFYPLIKKNNWKIIKSKS